MRIYKERGINPFASCLPTLIQFPIIIGLYQSIIHALAATPLGLLQLARSIYPFMNAAQLIPLNSKFLWMDLGTAGGHRVPRRILDPVSAEWISDSGDHRGRHDVSPDQGHHAPQRFESRVDRARP